MLEPRHGQHKGALPTNPSQTARRATKWGNKHIFPLVGLRDEQVVVAWRPRDQDSSPTLLWLFGWPWGGHWACPFVLNGRAEENMGLKTDKPALPPTGCDPRLITGPLKVSVSTYYFKRGRGDNLTYPPRRLHGSNDTIYKVFNTVPGT